MNRQDDSEYDRAHELNPMTSRKKSSGDKMRSRQSGPTKWTTSSANDNAPSRTIAGEGVVQCLLFLASELEQLGYSGSASNVLRAAFALQVEIDGEQTVASATAPNAKVKGTTKNAKQPMKRVAATSVVGPN